MKINVKILNEEQFEMYQSIEALKRCCISGKLKSSEMVQIENMTKKQKEKLVCELYFRNKRSKDFCYTRDGRVKSHNPQFIATTREGLIDKLYEYYFSNTLEDVYKEWVQYRSQTHIVSPKTIEEDISIWNRFIACPHSEIANMQLDQIKPVHVMKLFHTWTGNGQITRKDFNNRKSVLNGIFRYAVLHEIIASNPIASISCTDLNFKPPQRRKKAYTVEERRKLIDYLNTLTPDAYVYAILLDCYGIFRIGEIKGLVWQESDGNKVHIREQLVRERKLNDDLTFGNRYLVRKSPKGNPDYSIRTEYISDAGLQILQKMKALNPDGEFLFMYEGRPLNTDTFNRRLKKYCNNIGIPYLSSHALRFTGASILYNSGVNMVDIQPLLGHSNLNMSIRYLSQPVKENDTNLMANILK